MFRPYNPGQGQLPMHLDDLVPADDLVRVIHEFGERLNIKEILDTIKQRRKKSLYRGEPAYHPRLLLKLLLYGYCTGTFSSRKIAFLTRTSIPMMWLAGNERPNFRTISDFRKNHRQAIAQLFAQCLQLAKEMGMVKVGHIAIDGSRLKANASMQNGISRESLNAETAKLRDEVSALLQLAEEADQAEDHEHGELEGRALPEELANKQARLARLEEALATLEQQSDRSNRNHVNLTDPDARIIKRENKGSVLGYNGQIAVDGGSGVIVGATLSNNSDDKNQLIPTLDAVEEATEERPEKLSADTGYFSGENLRELEARSIDGYIADDAAQTRSKNPYSKEHFQYDPERDAFQCPQGQWLTFKCVSKQRGKPVRTYRSTTVCRACPVREFCTKSSYRQLTTDDNEARRAEMRAKLSTPDGKAEFARRKTIVEPVWGIIKQVMGFREVKMRGLAAVSADFLLVCQAFNLRKIHGKLRVSPELWSTVLSWTPEILDARV